MEADLETEESKTGVVLFGELYADVERVDTYAARVLEVLKDISAVVVPLTGPGAGTGAEAAEAEEVVEAGAAEAEEVVEIEEVVETEEVVEAEEVVKVVSESLEGGAPWSLESEPMAPSSATTFFCSTDMTAAIVDSGLAVTAASVETKGTKLVIDVISPLSAVETDTETPVVTWLVKDVSSETPVVAKVVVLLA